MKQGVGRCRSHEAARSRPADWFTGAVRVDPLYQAPDPARVSGASVTFEPGARTAWHTHPLGQTLVITSGFGWVQREGGSIEEVAGRRGVVSAWPEALAGVIAGLAAGSASLQADALDSVTAGIAHR